MSTRPHHRAVSPAPTARRHPSPGQRPGLTGPGVQALKGRLNLRPLKRPFRAQTLLRPIPGALPRAVMIWAVGPDKTTARAPLTTEAQHAIDLLQERRTALISAAVTGQIDVRQFAGKEAA